MIKKKYGVTATENLLAEFCERSFLKLWSYSNPYKEDGKELCDLLAVFDNTVFIFFDRKSSLLEASDKDPLIAWDRWKRNVIDRQIKTAHGAERYIRSGKKIFLDAKCEKIFPIPFEANTAIIHKVIVAHGAKEACEQASPQNIYGSLSVTYTNKGPGPAYPFHVEIDSQNMVHILDDHNMPIVLEELNTVADFKAYLDEKVRAANTFDYLSYCGEEDLLGHYLLNYDSGAHRHVIGPKQQDKINGVIIGEGEWCNFIETDLYKNTKSEDRISYFWDDLIQRTCQNSLDGTLGGNSDIACGDSAIHEMVKEPRFMRRGLSRKMLAAVEGFPDNLGFSRKVTFFPSFEPDVGYVLLQLRVPSNFSLEPDYREKRQAILEIACGAAKNKFPRLVKIIGIGIDAPKFSSSIAEDFLLMRCDVWPEETKVYYEELNKAWNFFGTSALQQYQGHLTQFVSPSQPSRFKRINKVGRNDLCPCGSGIKHKKCHGNISGEEY